MLVAIIIISDVLVPGIKVPGSGSSTYVILIFTAAL